MIEVCPAPDPNTRIAVCEAPARRAEIVDGHRNKLNLSSNRNIRRANCRDCRNRAASLSPRPSGNALWRKLSMNQRKTRSSAKPTAFRTCLAVSLLLSGVAGISNARADDDDFGFGFGFTPGNLLVSRSVYDNNPNNIQVGASLPPNCVAANCVIATANGSYPTVFNNNLVDGSFGITAKSFWTRSGHSDRWSIRSKYQTARSAESPHQRSDGHELLVQIGAGPQSVDRRPLRDVHGLPGAHRCDRRLELEYARRHRSHQPRPRKRTSASSRLWTSTATSVLPRPTRIAATTAAPRS